MPSVMMKDAACGEAPSLRSLSSQYLESVVVGLGLESGLGSRAVMVSPLELCWTPQPRPMRPRPLLIPPLSWSWSLSLSVLPVLSVLSSLSSVAVSSMALSASRVEASRERSRSE